MNSGCCLLRAERYRRQLPFAALHCAIPAFMPSSTDGAERMSYFPAPSTMTAQALAQQSSTRQVLLPLAWRSLRAACSAAARSGRSTAALESPSFVANATCRNAHEAQAGGGRRFQGGRNRPGQGGRQETRRGAPRCGHRAHDACRFPSRGFGPSNRPWANEIKPVETKKPWNTLRVQGFSVWNLGGAEEDRTPDLRIANATLSQLSYRPKIRRPQLYMKSGCVCNWTRIFFYANCSVATTGAWSEGCSLRRGSLSMTQAMQRLARGSESRTWSMRRPALRRNANWR